MTARPPFPELGLIAILRGLRPDDAEGVVGALIEAGFEAIEIPLNSPDPFRSIGTAVAMAPPRCLVGAGTVLTAADVARLHDIGGRLVVSPNVDAAVIEEAARRRMVTLPGVFTPTEAIAALAAGASGLKFFPASVLGAGGIAAIRAVLPGDATVGAVGGVSERDFEAYAQKDIRVFGLGSSLFTPSLTAAEVGARARAAVEEYDRVYGTA